MAIENHRRLAGRFSSRFSPSCRGAAAEESSPDRLFIRLALLLLMHRRMEAFRQGLRDLGYIEGKNILIEYRYVEGNQDRIPSLVAELVQLKVDVLVSAVYPAIRAAKQATKTIPIVMVITQDPVETGLVDSLARPGGNVTGLTRLTRDLSGKRLELLKEVVPRFTRWSPWRCERISRTTAFKDYETAARALKIPLQSLEVRGPNPDFEGAFQAAAKGRVNASRYD